MIGAWVLALFVQLGVAPNEAISVRLIGGETVEGRVAAVKSDGMQISTDRGVVWIESSLVSEAELSDRTLTQSELQIELRDRLEYELSRVDNNLVATPHPWVAASASLILPGLGQGILGQKQEAKGFLIADLAVLGLGSYLWFVQKDRGAAIPLFALDVIFRWSSSSQAYRLSQRRRALRAESQRISSGISQ